LSHPTNGAAIGPATDATTTATVTIADDTTELTTNLIDDTRNFVRQHYHDFLNREPDPAGLAFWIDNIDKCKDPMRRPAELTVAQCTEVMRINPRQLSSFRSSSRRRGIWCEVFMWRRSTDR
jgi:Domain of unknown function (DUF4214)